MNTTVDGLAEAIIKELSEYSQEVTDNLKANSKEVAKECSEELKETSPKRYKKYCKSWKAKVAYEDKSDIRIIVHNKKHYQLTHLLEYGHAKTNGGRVEGIPHIAPAEKHAAEKLMKKVKIIVKG